MCAMCIPSPESPGADGVGEGEVGDGEGVCLESQASSSCAVT